ncbi:AAA family ATPase, putative [Paecilomyces variotii No. 5]|uniref:AAA family ATPase, putative n=1 Tax=Byssochlamys spectabilis (strain No. 5 / NBRC 109023) TaxID=1356009 RepID=V5FYJ1_BYSSN|nr:AAA family ATPase, putative [Paecilomyces variotii No. 5]
MFTKERRANEANEGNSRDNFPRNELSCFRWRSLHFSYFVILLYPYYLSAGYRPNTARSSAFLCRVSGFAASGTRSSSTANDVTDRPFNKRPLSPRILAVQHLLQQHARSGHWTSLTGESTLYDRMAGRGLQPSCVHDALKALVFHAEDSFDLLLSCIVLIDYYACALVANNEAEALRSWRNALETIYYHNAYRVPPNYVPKTETEKALQESIRQLEMQCKERVQLLEALQESRKEAEKTSGQATPRGKLEKGKGPSTGSSANTTPGWIGNGTIPAVDYMDLSRPLPLPPRPTAASKKSSDSVIQKVGEKKGSPARDASNAVSSPPILPVPKISPTATPRGTSPEKRKGMLTTLRTKDKKSSSKSRNSPGRNGNPPAASKAAGLAWGTTLSQTSSSERNPGAGEAALASSRLSMSSDSGAKRDQDLKNTSSDESSRPSRAHGLSDYIPNSSWREPQHTERSPRRTSTTTQVTYSSILPRETSGLLSPVRLPEPTSSPKPVIKPKPTALRTPVEASRPQAYRKQSSHSQPSLSPAEDLAWVRKSQTRSAPGIKPRDHPYTSNSSGSGDEGVRRSARKTELNRVNAVSQPRRKVHAAPPQRVTPSSSEHEWSDGNSSADEEDINIENIMKRLPKGVDPTAARQILNDIVVRGDEVHWDDVAGLEVAKKALKEAVVYPFLRPDLFSGLREPARGVLLFGPPGTGKTMLARAVATESKSTFFSVSASSLTSKWHGESEKLVRALFGLAKALAPSIIFVDEIDSLLSSRSSGTENEASRRSKTEFLIQWSDLQRAAAGRESKEGDASRVLVLAATNMPWDIDEAARRRFVRRQYIPLPEHEVREQQIRKLLSHQKHELSDTDIEVLVRVTEGFSGSDITALAKDAAMGPLRNLGEDLLHTPMEKIRPIRFSDFEASLYSIRPSVSPEGLKEYENWARQFGERGG